MPTHSGGMEINMNPNENKIIDTEQNAEVAEKTAEPSAPKEEAKKKDAEKLYPQRLSKFSAEGLMQTSTSS